MAFRNEEYVKACLRKAAWFRRLAAGIAAGGSALFAGAWWYERATALRLLWIQPLPALVAAVCLAGVAIALVAGELTAKGDESDGL